MITMSFLKKKTWCNCVAKRQLQNDSGAGQIHVSWPSVIRPSSDKIKNENKNNKLEFLKRFNQASSM